MVAEAEAVMHPGPLFAGRLPARSSLTPISLSSSLCPAAKAVVVSSTSGYQEPTAENIGTWLENPENIKAWERSLA